MMQSLLFQEALVLANGTDRRMVSECFLLFTWPSLAKSPHHTFGRMLGFLRVTRNVFEGQWYKESKIYLAMPYKLSITQLKEKRKAGIHLVFVAENWIHYIGNFVFCNCFTVTGVCSLLISAFYNTYFLFVCLLFLLWGLHNIPLNSLCIIT